MSSPDGQLHQSVNVEADILAVGEACDHTAELAALVGDANFDVGNFVMIVHLSGLGRETVADLGAAEEHDVVLDAESESLTTVHHSGQSNVGQGEINTSLADATRIEMVGGDGELCRGIALAHFHEFAAAIGSKTVVLRQKFF